MLPQTFSNVPLGTPIPLESASLSVGKRVFGHWWKNLRAELEEYFAQTGKIN